MFEDMGYDAASVNQPRRAGVLMDHGQSMMLKQGMMVSTVSH